MLETDDLETGRQLVSMMLSPELFRLLRHVGEKNIVDEKTAIAIVGKGQTAVLPLIILSVFNVFDHDAYKIRKEIMIGSKGQDILDTCRRIGALERLPQDRSWDDVVSFKPHD